MTYYAKKSTHGLVELRQSRYKEQFDRGNEHPHDLCATAHSVKELREMVEKHNLGYVDWTAAASLEDKPEADEPAPFRP
jgi:hypothetical protein